jgi:hypothetical protein
MYLPISLDKRSPIYCADGCFGHPVDQDASKGAVRYAVKRLELLIASRYRL